MATVAIRGLILALVTRDCQEFGSDDDGSHDSGRQWGDRRRVLGGILWVMRTGATWRELPPAFGAAKTAYDCDARWRRDGTWACILAALQPPSSGERIDGNVPPQHSRILAARRAVAHRKGRL